MKVKTHYEVLEVVEALINNPNVIRAVKYVSPVWIVRATRKRFGGKILKRGNVEIILTIGRPNYIEREFVKLCHKAGEKFPMRGVHLKLYNPKPNKLKRKKKC